MAAMESSGRIHFEALGELGRVPKKEDERVGIVNELQPRAGRRQVGTGSKAWRLTNSEDTQGSW